MLRVHPAIRTSDLPRAAAFLRALGLRPAEDPAPTPSTVVFDAGHGRVTLHTGPVGDAPGTVGEGTTDLAFDVGDVREFARRTNEAGTLTEISGEGAGLTAWVDTPDGTTFPAAVGPRDTGAPASPLTVVARWRTADPDDARRVLEDIGAKPHHSRGGGHRYRYRAKNGGLVTVEAGQTGQDDAPSDRVTVDLAFEYDGDVRELLGDLAAVGSGPVSVEDRTGRSLRVDTPWGTALGIHQRQPDDTTAP
ncbi:hypothetical protein AC792_07210 [Arthrobacter sp. RIT-PI-e]|uniref:VOC family protein n=1 Tax=Arthrobacter sp. RIT-PI-e TaxID=1681197 RepID=UPI0006764100|nr:VOC family protein [Arthrobacter sp. RIT-PI-e]KNC19355.1 hypothetical protein AC792_07210 [Arthrobacter sp. RIT-PI-e]